MVSPSNSAARELDRDLGVSSEVPLEAVRAQLRKMLTSGTFARSERMKRFLDVVVTQTLGGLANTLKEYSIALAVFDKPEGFEPHLDPIVRVEAGRLRSKLREYYEGEGRQDAVLIRFRKRSYVPVFEWRDTRQTSTALAMTPSAARTLPIVSAQSAGAPPPYADRLARFLKARHFWNKRSPDALRNAVRHFEQTIAMDPRYGPAYAGLADSYSMLIWLDALDPSSGWKKVEEMARRALELDGTSGHPHATLGCLHALYQWDWAAAEAAFQRAIELNPSDANARHWYAVFCLVPQQRLEEALMEMSRAQELDPLSAPISSHLGWVLHCRRQYDAAREQFRRSLTLDPCYYLSHRFMGEALEQQHQWEDARAAYTRAYELSGGEPSPLAGLARCHARMGRLDDARRFLAELGTAAERPLDVALVYAGLGDLDAAFRHLRAAWDARCARLVHLKVDPAFDPLKSNPRFLTLLRAVSLDR